MIESGSANHQRRRPISYRSWLRSIASLRSLPGAAWPSSAAVASPGMLAEPAPWAVSQPFPAERVRQSFPPARLTVGALRPWTASSSAWAEISWSDGIGSDPLGCGLRPRRARHLAEHRARLADHVDVARIRFDESAEDKLGVGHVETAGRHEIRDLRGHRVRGLPSGHREVVLFLFDAGQAGHGRSPWFSLRAD